MSDGYRRVALVSTGGTIEMIRGSRGLSMTDRFNPLPIDGEVVPDGVRLCHHKFASLPSPHITPVMMGGLCRMLRGLTECGDFEGIVVTHGTDTLEESAFLADCSLPDDGPPVVFTAAMRSPSEMGVDGPRNLRGAILVATDAEVHNLGVTVVLSDEIHAAGRVTKTYTSNVSSFSSPGYGPLGFVDQDRVLVHRRPAWRLRLPPMELRMEAPVSLVRVASGFGDRPILDCVERGDAGIVVEAMGRGNVPPPVAAAVETAVREGLTVCVSSRCYMGRVLGVYGYEGGGADLEERGAIMAGDVQGHKLRLFLMAALDAGMDRERIAELLAKA